MNILSFDVETYGFKGEAFAIGWCVIDEDGNELEYSSCANGFDESKCADSDLNWLKDNIPFYYRGEPKGHTESRLADCLNAGLKKFPDAKVAVDCGFPCETSFLTRNKISVYPLFELNTILLANGYNPTETYPRNKRELPVHCPLADSRQTARMFRELLINKKLNHIGGE